MLTCIKIDNCCISRVNQTKFLGIITDEHLTWMHYINSIRDKISKGIAMLKLLQCIFFCHTCLIVQSCGEVHVKIMSIL